MAKKRANGEGSIRKKPSGRWEGRYTQGIDPVTGRAIQKSVSAKTLSLIHIFFDYGGQYGAVQAVSGQSII